MAPLLLVAGLACTGDDPTPPASCDPPAGPGTSWTDPVTDALRCPLDGVELREGWFDLFVEEDCEALLLEEDRSCYGHHAATPYLQPRFAEDDDGDVIATYQLDQDEALLFVGRTPPSGRYFSFNNYQYQRALGGGEYEKTFGTFARSVNMLTLTTAGAPTAPYDDYTAVVFTANATTAERTRELLVPILARNGYPDVVNVSAIGLADDEDYARLAADPAYGPDDVFQLTMGYGPEADRDSLLLRIAALEDPDDPYLDTTRVPAATFKVRFDDRPGYDPLPFPHLPPEDLTDERQPDDLRAARDAVAAAIVDVEVADGFAVDSRAFDNEPQQRSVDCLNGLDLCNAINDDARYLRSMRYKLPRLSNVPNSVFVVGILHADVPERDPDAPPVAYSSLSIMNFTDGAGVLGLLDRDLEGSLRDFFPDGVPGVPIELEPLLYVHRFARRCGDSEAAGSCTEIPSEPPLGIEEDDLVWFTERVYLNATSKTAPHETSVIEPLIVAAASSVTFVQPGNPAMNHILVE